MQKNTQANRLVELIAISGELPANAVYRLEGGRQYKDKLITNLKNTGMIHTHYKDKLRGYRLMPKAKKMLLEQNPGRFEFYLEGNVDTNHVKSEVIRRLRLHRIAETVITMYNAGVEIFRGDKPDVFYNDANPPFMSKPLTVTSPAFYGSREFKEIDSELLKLKNARAVGLLLTASEIFSVYNTEDASMKWDYNAEIGAKGALKYYLCQKRLAHQYKPESIKGLILGNSMDILIELITSTDGRKRNYFFLDNSFDSFMFLTNDEHGGVLLKLLCNVDMQKELDRILRENLHPPDKGLLIENDALDENNAPVLFSYLVDMPRIVRFTTALMLQERTGSIICFDFQKEVLSKYCGEHVNFDTIDFIQFKKSFNL